jgi:GNAT superfamily N-acetyltransferase
MASGCFLQVVGWDGAEPVAMVEMIVVYDAMRRVQVAHGDKAYVHPAYRKNGTFEAMLAFMVPLMDLIGIEHWVAPVTAGPNATAPWLVSMYERFGFEQTGITMERRAA